MDHVDVKEGSPIFVEEDNENEGHEAPDFVPTPTNNTGERPTKRKRRLTSHVWAYFDILPLGADKKERTKCKRCGAIYLSSSRNGTGNMIRHIKSCPNRDVPNVLQDISQDVGRYIVQDVGQEAGCDVGQDAGQDVEQMIISHPTSSMPIKSSQFDPLVFREMIAFAIVKHDLPLRFVEYDSIREAFRYVNQEIELGSRNTVMEDILKIYSSEKGSIKKLLYSVPGRVSLTLDWWSSLTNDRYIILTAHFVDSGWNLQKRILSFSYIPLPYSDVAICEKLHTLLTEWDIEKKLFSITLENDSSNDSYVGLLRSQLNLKDALLSNGEFFHLHCFAHILKLMMQEGLKEIDESIVKIRESVKYFKGLQGRKKAFVDCVKQMSLPCNKGLRQDINTRWDSTYLMLKSALFYRSAFLHMQLTDSDYRDCPSEEEWDRVEKVCKFLGVFYSATCIFSNTKYPTSNLYFPQAFLVQDTLTKAVKDTDAFMSKVAFQMKEKFEKYWSKCSLILAISVILDPRYKFQFVEFCYQRLYGSCSKEMRDVSGKLSSLFHINLSTFSNSAPSNSDNAERQEKTNDFFEEFDRLEMTKLKSTTQKSQLELYLIEPKMKRKTELDILDFWEANRFRYPELSLMARDILSIPISTVNSEDAFNVGDKVLDQFSTALLPGNVEALVCTRNWFFDKKDNLEPTIEELTEDVLAIDISRMA